MADFTPLPTNAAQETGGNLATVTKQLAGTVTVAVAGSISAAVTGTQTVTVTGSVTLSETPTVAISGTSTVQVAGISAGTVAIAGTSTVEVAGIVGTSTVEVAGIVGTSTVTISGTVACSGTQTVTVSGNVTLAETPTVAISGTATVEVAGIIGTSTVEVAGIVGTSTVAVAGTSTVAVTGQIAGPVAAGTAASSSVLTGSVYNTAAPSLTNTQQAARQADSSGNLRVNPYGNVGSFQNVSVTSTVTASATLQVAAATKWNVKSIRFAAQPSNTVTKQAVVWVTDAAGRVMWEASSPVFTPTNTLIYEVQLYPGATGPVNTNGPTVSATLNLVGFVVSARGTATQVLTLQMPELFLGPSFQVNGMLNGAVGTVTGTLSVNAIVISD